MIKKADHKTILRDLFAYSNREICPFEHPSGVKLNCGATKSTKAQKARPLEAK